MFEDLVHSVLQLGCAAYAGRVGLARAGLLAHDTYPLDFGSGAGLALLITGPAANMATIGILSRLHGARFAYAFAAVIIVAAIAVGLLVNAVLPVASMPTLSPSSLDRTSPLELFSVIALAALYAASLLRRGARGFLGELQMLQP